MQISTDLITALAQLPLNQFHGFDLQRRNGLILFKFAEPAYAGVIDVNPACFILDNATLYFMKSLSVIFAYAIHFENKILTIVDPDYTVITRPSSQNITHHHGVHHQYHDQYINAYSSQDGATLITRNDLYNVITRNMVRRSRRAEDR